MNAKMIDWKTQTSQDPDAILLEANVLGVAVAVRIARDVHDRFGINKCMAMAEEKLAKAIASSGSTPQHVHVEMSDLE